MINFNFYITLFINNLSIIKVGYLLLSLNGIEEQTTNMNESYQSPYYLYFIVYNINIYI